MKKVSLINFTIHPVVREKVLKDEDDIHYMKVAVNRAKVTRKTFNRVYIGPIVRLNLIDFPSPDYKIITN